MTAPELAAADVFVLACSELAQRFGAVDFQLRIVEDAKPPIWVSYVRSAHGIQHVAAGLSADTAVYLAAEWIADGRACVHCGKPVAVLEIDDNAPLSESAVCWYRYFPTAGRFRPACERTLTVV